MRRIQLEFKKDNVIPFYPPEGRPDGAADLFVYTQGTSPLDGTLDPLSVALDLVNEALTLAAVKGADNITVADTSNVKVGRRYILKNQEGDTQEVFVRAKTASLVRFDQPIRFACDVTTSVLEGHRLAATILGALLNTRRRFGRLRWEYEIDGVAVHHDELFDVVLLPFNLVLTEEDVERHYTAFGESIGSRRSWRKLREGVFDDIWRALRGMQVHPDLVRDREMLTDAAAFRLLVKHFQSNPEQREFWLALYKDAMAEFYASHAWYDTGDDMQADFLGVHFQQIGDEEVQTIVTPGLAVGGADFRPETLGIPVDYMKVG